MILLDLPFLWSTLDSSMTGSHVDAYLFRSGDVGLTILLYGQSRGSSVDDLWSRFMARVLPHSRRWREFRFRPGEFTTPEMYTRLCRELTGLELPRLEIFGVSHNGDTYKSVAEAVIQCPQLSIPHFYKDWTASNLKKAAVSIPLSLHLSDFRFLERNRLTSLEISIFGYRPPFTGLGVSEVLAFLRLFPMLCDLQLTLFRAVLKSTGGVSVPPVPLHALKSFSTVFHGRCTEAARLGLGELMRAMQMPKLVEYCCSTDMPITALQNARSVKDLRLIGGESVNWEEVLSVFPNLEKLEVACMTFSDSPTLEHRSVGPMATSTRRLRQLNFIYCRFDSIPHMQKVINQILGDEAGLEKVGFRCCRGLGRERPNWDIPRVEVEWVC